MVAVSGVGSCEIGEGLVGRDLGRLVHEAGRVLEMAVFETFGDAGPAVGAGDLQSVCLSGGLSFARHGLKVEWRVGITSMFFLMVYHHSAWKSRLKRVDEGVGSGYCKDDRQFFEAPMDGQSTAR